MVVSTPGEASTLTPHPPISPKRVPSPTKAAAKITSSSRQASPSKPVATIMPKTKKENEQSEVMEENQEIQLPEATLERIREELQLSSDTESEAGHHDGIYIQLEDTDKEEEERMSEIAEAVSSIQTPDEIAENNVPLVASTAEAENMKQLLPIPSYPDVEPDNPSAASEETPAPLQIDEQHEEPPAPAPEEEVEVLTSMRKRKQKSEELRTPDETEALKTPKQSSQKRQQLQRRSRDNKERER